MPEKNDAQKKPINMAELNKLLIGTKKLLSMRFGLVADEILAASFQFRSDLKYHTAATNGTDIYIDPHYFLALGVDERLFLLAHEFFHVKFKHVQRARELEKKGVKFSHKLWNIATDAVINAMLNQNDNLPIKPGYVDKPDAFLYNAEEYYKILLKEYEEKKEEKKKQQKQGGNSQKQDQEPQGSSGDENESSDQSDSTEKQKGDKGKKDKSDQSESKDGESGDFDDDFDDVFDDDDEEYTGSDHYYWDEENEQSEEDEKNNGNGSLSRNENSRSNREWSEKNPFEEVSIENRIDEKEFFEENKKMQEERVRQYNEQEQNRIQSEKETLESKETDNLTGKRIGVGEATRNIDWTEIIEEELPQPIYRNSTRRSIKENNYDPRKLLIKRRSDEKQRITVVIDISGSVHINMVRAFLSELKGIAEERQLDLYVGTFNTRSWKPVKMEQEDIDNFSITDEQDYYSSGTDLDCALGCFDPEDEDEVNRIIFTDAYFNGGYDGLEKYEDMEVNWLNYGNKDFIPPCGKVVMLDVNKDLRYYNNLQRE